MIEGGGSPLFLPRGNRKFVPDLPWCEFFGRVLSKPLSQFANRGTSVLYDHLFRFECASASSRS
jgi:hypothetical protein